MICTLIRERKGTVLRNLWYIYPLLRGLRGELIVPLIGMKCCALTCQSERGSYDGRRGAGRAVESRHKEVPVSAGHGGDVVDGGHGRSVANIDREGDTRTAHRAHQRNGCRRNLRPGVQLHVWNECSCNLHVHAARYVTSENDSEQQSATSFLASLQIRMRFETQQSVNSALTDTNV